NAFAPGSLLLPIHRLVLKMAVPTETQVARSEASRAQRAEGERRPEGGPSEVHQDWLRERLPGWECRSGPIAGASPLPDLAARHLEPLRDQHAFAADDASGQLRIFSRPRRDAELTVRVIHRDVIEGLFGLDEAAVRAGAIAYPKSALQTARDLRAGRGAV